MKILRNKCKKFRKGKLFTFFVITILSLFISYNVYSLYTSYDNFKWDEFYETQKNFWEEICTDSNGNIDQTCNSQILSSQKQFYTKFYKTLAKYDRKQLHIEDYILIQTIFYDMSPSQISDDSKEYLLDYYFNEESIIGKKGAYSIDQSDFDDPLIDISWDSNGGDYYKQETDTIKLLTRNMIAYSTSCYGIYGNPETIFDENGTPHASCSQGEPTNFDEGIKCADAVQQRNEMNFWEYYVSKVRNKLYFDLDKDVVDENYNSCMATEGYEQMKYLYNDDEHVSTNRYFDYLSYNKYFDNKVHLQSHFKERVLIPAGVDCLTNSVCDNSLENKSVIEGKDLYEEYKEELIEVRREIVANIISVLNSYGYDIYYDPLGENTYTSLGAIEAQRNTFYWPIGSVETEERNGTLYADENPSSIRVINNYGTTVNGLTNYGIDILGDDGNTNVIGVYRGEVVAVVNSCVVGDKTCNDGYGNMIVLSHSNGDYTVYAHLSTIDSSVSMGASVDKGQVIGKVGATGNTETANLHFELRKGGNTVTNASNPLEYLDSENPRPKIAVGDFSVHEHTALSREEFVSKLNNYCKSNACIDTFKSEFVNQAGTVYDLAEKHNLNVELLIVRGFLEGMDPGKPYNNYWGIGCFNGATKEQCSHYNSLDDGIRGFANVTRNYTNVSDMMSKYAYIGKFWYNTGKNEWGLGGCTYFNYISQYMTPERANFVSNVCNSGILCYKEGGSGCTPTTEEDQYAYTLYQIRHMVELRSKMFDL